MSDFGKLGKIYNANTPVSFSHNHMISVMFTEHVLYYIGNEQDASRFTALGK